MNDAKAILRASLRQSRRDLLPVSMAGETSATVAALSRLLSERGHPPLASYMAVRGELDLADLHRQEWSAGRPVWLPRVVGQRLTWHPLRGLDHLRPGSFAIPEPDPGQVPDQPLPPQALLVVPGVGFAADGARLGQGAGFYDRLLADFTGLSVGVGFTCQRHDGLPHEAHDRPVRAVLLGGSWVLPPPR